MAGPVGRGNDQQRGVTGEALSQGRSGSDIYQRRARGLLLVGRSPAAAVTVMGQGGAVMGTRAGGYRARR